MTRGDTTKKGLEVYEFAGAQTDKVKENLCKQSSSKHERRKAIFLAMTKDRGEFILVEQKFKAAVEPRRKQTKKHASFLWNKGSAWTRKRKRQTRGSKKPTRKTKKSRKKTSGGKKSRERSRAASACDKEDKEQCVKYSLYFMSTETQGAKPDEPDGHVPNLQTLEDAFELNHKYSKKSRPIIGH